MQISSTRLAAYEAQRAQGVAQQQPGKSNGTLPGAFGPAYMRMAGAELSESTGLYGSDAKLRQAKLAGLNAKEQSLEDVTTRRGADGQELTEGEEAQIEKLRQRDAKVRSHEAAHVLAAGGQAGMPTYTYQTGPDGRRYAIGGAVNISIMRTGDPEKDAREASTAQRAALAAGEASTADLQTAARAGDMTAQANARAMERGLERYQKQALA
ncbi:MAG: hypothetical protein LBV80_08860 [Deltaproteobacteria bacterium]|nr:hypothetical protein [Deltaproteobacteria bacterium]